MENENGYVTYWESRQINIGNYENISFGATVKSINANDRGAVINAIQSVTLTGKTPELALEEAKAAVQRMLNTREKLIRIQSNNNGNTDFDTLKKAQDFGVMESLEKSITAVETPAAVKRNKAFDDDEWGDDEIAEKTPVNTKKKLHLKITPPKEDKSIPSDPPRSSKFQTKTATGKPGTGLFASSKFPDPPPLDTSEELPE